MRNAPKQGLHFALASAVLVAIAICLSLLPKPNASHLDARLREGYPLRVGYAIEPPYAFIDEQGELRGESVDLLRATLQRLEVGEVRFVRVDLGELINELEAGRIDLIAGGLLRTPERDTRARFTRPTAAVLAGVLIRVDEGPARPVRLAVISGSVEAAHPERLVEGELERIEFAEAAQARAALARGEVDALALSTPSLRWMLTHRLERPEDYELRLLESIQPGYPAYALPKHETAFAERMDAALAELIGSSWHLQAVEGYGFGSLEVRGARDWEQGR
jgi:polar amino acid transport system substrate-binding protein